MYGRIAVKKERNRTYNIGIEPVDGRLRWASPPIAEEDLAKYFTPEAITFLKNKSLGEILRKKYLITLS
jgi:hypothetical protein